MAEIMDYIDLYVKEALKENTKEVSISLENNIKAEAPYLQGRLKRSIRVDSRLYDTYSIITGYWDEGVAPHGIFVLAGTKPHIIKPKNKKALAWEGMSTDYPVGAVHHPGTKPNDFLGRGLSKTLEAYK